LKYLNYLKIPYKPYGTDFSGTDCYGLIRLFYKTELQVDLPHFTDDADDNWFCEYFMKLHQKYGFQETGLVSFGDLIFFRTSPTKVGHVGIVLDEFSFLHMTIHGCGIGNYKTGAWQRQIACKYHFRMAP
jgi:cell wall-associated NlpC family hydrolase